MHFSSFLLSGPSMNKGLYDYNSYMPEDKDKFIKDVESLNITALKFPPDDFNERKVIKQWKSFKTKADYLKKSLYVISFAIVVPFLCSNPVLIITTIVMTSIALASLGFYRSYQADVQVDAWPEVNSTLLIAKRKIIELKVLAELNKQNLV